MLHLERHIPGLASALILLSVGCSGKEEEADSGDLYPTLADPSEGDALRQRCLDGEIFFCD